MHSYVELSDIHADAIDLSNDVAISCNAISYNITRLSQSSFQKPVRYNLVKVCKADFDSAKLR